MNRSGASIGWQASDDLTPVPWQILLQLRMQCPSCFSLTSTKKELSPFPLNYARKIWGVPGFIVRHSKFSPHELVVFLSYCFAPICVSASCFWSLSNARRIRSPKRKDTICLSGVDSLPIVGYRGYRQASDCYARYTVLD